MKDYCNTCKDVTGWVLFTNTDLYQCQRCRVSFSSKEIIEKSKYNYTNPNREPLQ